MTGMTQEKQTALDWVAANEAKLSAWHGTIWDFHEPAWREYRSAAWYVEVLRQEGFEVEEGSGGMPTAFCAVWDMGGPMIGAYAEYDAVPGNSQERVPYRKPRAGVHRWAAGHTDPHSGLGIGALGGVLAAKAAIEKHGLEASLKFFGEPAEKVCGSKPVHAAKGYYDDLDPPRLLGTLTSGKAKTMIQRFSTLIARALFFSVLTLCAAPLRAQTISFTSVPEGYVAGSIDRCEYCLDHGAPFLKYPASTSRCFFESFFGPPFLGPVSTYRAW